MTDSILWFATRGAGIVSLLLFTGVLTLGILTAGRWQTRSWPRFITAKLHRDIALLSVVFLGVHIVTAVVDPFTALGPLAALVPFAVDYQRLWLGLGVLALDLGVAVVATSLLRSRVGVRTWRTVHWLSYAAWPLALVHGVGIGTDTSASWMQAIDIACVALVVGATAWRFLVDPLPSGRTAAGQARPTAAGPHGPGVGPGPIMADMAGEHPTGRGDHRRADVRGRAR
jgi:predicted ferric reductase